MDRRTDSCEMVGIYESLCYVWLHLPPPKAPVPGYPLKKVTFVARLKLALSLEVLAYQVCQTPTRPMVREESCFWSTHSFAGRCGRERKRWNASGLMLEIVSTGSLNGPFSCLVDTAAGSFGASLAWSQARSSLNHFPGEEHPQVLLSNTERSCRVHGSSTPWPRGRRIPEPVVAKTKHC